jgi:hypothetical protein
MMLHRAEEDNWETHMRHGAARIAIGVLLGFIAAAAAGRDGSAGPPGAPASCATPAYRQFDFFAGDWDTYDVAAPSKLVARNKVTLILGGCVVHEVYRQTDGLVGESFSLYDTSRGGWHQSWVTNRGSLLLLDGGLDGDRMALTATEKSSDGTTSLLRGVWRREGTAVRETAERSTDGGKSWTPVFDIVFRPHGSH